MVAAYERNTLLSVWGTVFRLEELGLAGVCWIIVHVTHVCLWVGSHRSPELLLC